MTFFVALLVVFPSFLDRLGRPTAPCKVLGALHRASAIAASKEHIWDELWVERDSSDGSGGDSSPWQIDILLAKLHIEISLSL